MANMNNKKVKEGTNGKPQWTYIMLTPGTAAEVAL